MMRERGEVQFERIEMPKPKNFSIKSSRKKIIRTTRLWIRSEEEERKKLVDYRPLFSATIGYETGRRKLPLRFQISIIKLDGIVHRRNRKTMNLRHILAPLSLSLSLERTMKHSSIHLRALLRLIPKYLPKYFQMIFQNHAFVTRTSWTYRKFEFEQGIKKKYIHI